MRRGALWYAGVLLFLSSCNFGLVQYPLSDDDTDGDFYAYDYVQRKYYKVATELLAENALVSVYVETSAALSPQTAQQIADEYKARIHPRVTAVFGDPAQTTGREKLVLLFLDIKDGWNGGAFTAGYFNPIDLYPSANNNPYSNNTNMLYLDTYPSLTSFTLQETYATIAHELQHLINCSARNDLQGDIMNMIQQGVWVDEGLSLTAEDIYRLDINQSKIDYFNQSSRNGSSIPLGDNFFVWAQGSYDEYVTDYLFFKWLRIHAGSAQRDLIQSIANSEKLGVSAVIDAVKEYIPGFLTDFQIDNDDSDDAIWVELLRTWHLANLMNTAPSVPSRFYSYSYNGAGFSVNPPWYIGQTAATMRVSLAPGEAVYSNMVSGSVMSDIPVTRISTPPAILVGADPSANPHIEYSYGIVSSLSQPALITFNTNTNNRSYARESGYAKRSSPIILPSAQLQLDPRHASPAPPLPIDARPPPR
jgi:hypothetical protein